MTLNKLASLIAKREGKKHQASIGDIREILNIIVDLEFEAVDEGLATGEEPDLPVKAIFDACKKKIMKEQERLWRLRGSRKRTNKTTR